MILKKTIIICVLYSIILSCNDIESYYEPLPENIDFNFHVKPILVQNCYLCHGPDPSSRKANLRLDTNEGLMAILEGGGFAVVPGKTNKSHIINRINNPHEDKIMPIRDMWKGKLVIKGIANESDVEKAISLGVDGIIVSNHGGRQLDAGESSVKPLTRIAEKYGKDIKVMMDSGIRSGPDIARSLASGADFTFLGRSFMYGVSALGEKGGDHTISLLKTELQQVMEQICCENVNDFMKHLIKK